MCYKALSNCGMRNATGNLRNVDGLWQCWSARGHVLYFQAPRGQCGMSLAMAQRLTSSSGLVLDLGVQVLDLGIGLKAEVLLGLSVDLGINP